MTYDYKRHGTTTLFAALDYLQGKVFGQRLPRHRHQEFLKFLRTLDREFPRDLDLHSIVDNHGTHNHPNVKAWLAKHFPFSPAPHPDQLIVAEPGGAVVPPTLP